MDCKWGKLPNEGGIGPERLLENISNVRRELRFPTSLGIDPDRPLALRLRYCSLDKLPMVLGMLPKSLLVDKSRG